MGRIKTMLIKRIAKKLISEHDEEFSPEFDKNKDLVSKYTTVSSPKMRNVIAGYTARLKRQKNVSENQPRRRVNEEDLSKYYK
jgi:small subunit ribosomal protein S17e